MKRQFIRYGVGAGITALSVLGPAAPAGAGLGKKLVRGITFGLSPNIGTVQNGPNFNNNFFAQRFSRNPLTDGVSYEITRLFGDDTFGNADTLNLGLLDVQLREPDGSGLRGAGVFSRVGFNRYLVPEMFWDQRTTARNISTFSGSSAVSSPVQYLIQANAGLQDVVLSGSLLVDTSGSINALGFYDLTFTASNTGTIATSGILGSQSQDTNFDLGPVNLSGNVLVDLSLATLELIGGQLGLPPELLPGVAARHRTPDEIAEAVSTGESISGPELGVLLTTMIDHPDEVVLEPDASREHGPEAPLGFSDSRSDSAPIPEPGTAGLLLASLAGGIAGRRRSR